MSRPASVPGAPVSGGKPRTRLGLLFLALGIGLSLRLFVALTGTLEYNGYWHVFIARNLAREYGSLAHPPLFLFLLKAADSVSHSRLAYQLVPVLAGLGAVALVFLVLEKLRASAVVAFLGALTMATAQSAVFLSVDVQSYMLAVFLILWSFLFYLDLVRPEPAGWRPRAAFLFLASVALLTEYFAGLYLAASVLAPLLVAACRPAYRRALLRALPRRFLPDLATLLPPAVVGALLYELVAKPWIRRLNHLPEFYFQPDAETAAAFLTRNLWNVFNIFSPAVLWSPRRAAALVMGFALLTFIATVTERRREVEGSERAMPAAILCVLLGLGMLLGLRGLYPFGGAMRQQFLYFLFALLAGFLAFDRVLRAVPSRATRGALVALCGLSIGANLFLHWRDFQPPGRDPFVAQARLFDRDFPGVSAVQTDQFNFIGFFIPHHDWDWTFRGTLAGLPNVQRYELEKDGRFLTLLAHRDVWNFDLSDSSAFARLRAAAAAAGLSCSAAFVVHQNLYKPPERRLPHVDESVLRTRMPQLAGEQGLRLERVAIRGDDVYAELCPEGTPLPPPR